MSQANSASSKIPNLYELLKLQPKEPDEQVIRNALKELAERVKQIESPEKAQQAAKLFAVAKQNLLDPKRKAAYDSLWEKVFGTSQSDPASPANEKSSQAIAATLAKVAANAMSKIADNSKGRASQSPTDDADRKENIIAAESLPVSAVPVQDSQMISATATVEEVSDFDLSELNALLPSGDPSAPLDLAAFLETTDINPDGQRTIDDLERDFQRLFKLLGGAVADEAVTVSAPKSSSDDLFAFASQPSSSSATSSSGFATTTDAIPTATLATVAHRTKSPVKARKRRDGSLLLMIGGGITTLLLVLGFLLMMLKKNNDAKQIAIGPSPSNSDNSSKPEDSKPKPGKPMGSGLPQPGSGLPKPGEKLGGEEGMQGDGMNAALPNNSPPATMSPTNNQPSDMQQNTSQPNTPSPPVTQPDKPSPDNSTTPPPATEPPTTPPSTPAATPEVMNKPNDSVGSTEKPNATPPMEAAEEKAVELTAQEKAAWKKQMTDARNAIGNREFDKAAELLEKIGPTAKNANQKAQLARLKTIAPLAKQFHEALVEALKSSEAGDQLKVKEQEIGFTDFVDGKTIVVKIARQKAPVRYEFSDLPVNLAYAFADLKLDQSPTSAAAKASFTAVHRKANQNNKDEARKLMQAAAAANAVPADTHEIFDDNYNLD